MQDRFTLLPIPINISLHKRLFASVESGHSDGRVLVARNICQTLKVSRCTIHDFCQDMNVSDDVMFECVDCKAARNLKICLYPTPSDVYVSGFIRNFGSWELDLNKAIMGALNFYQNAAFLDIGANIGMHSLVAARRGKRVFAVEPNVDTVKRLHKSINLNRLHENFTLITNGISDVRENLTLLIDETNRGRSSIVLNAGAGRQPIKTVLFDDLLEVIDVPQVVIKIDIEGAEARAFRFSKEFFLKVNVKVIFMEWVNLKTSLLYGQPAGLNIDKRDLDDLLQMVENFQSLGFVPKRINMPFTKIIKSRENLTRTHMFRWPNDIVWVR